MEIQYVNGERVVTSYGDAQNSKQRILKISRAAAVARAAAIARKARYPAAPKS